MQDYLTKIKFGSAPVQPAGTVIGAQPAPAQPNTATAVKTPAVLPVSKETIKNNAGGRIASKVTDHQSKGYMGPVYGLGMFLGLNQLNNYITAKDRFGNFINNLENNPKVTNFDTAVNSKWTKYVKPITDKALKPFQGLISHFKTHANDIKPKNGFAVQHCRNKYGQMADSYIMTAQAYYKKQNPAKHQMLNKVMDNFTANKLNEAQVIEKVDKVSRRKSNELKKIQKGIGKLINKSENPTPKQWNVYINRLRNHFAKDKETLKLLEGVWENLQQNKIKPGQAFTEINKLFDRLPKELKLVKNQIKVAQLAPKTMLGKTLVHGYTHLNDYFNFHMLKAGGPWHKLFMFAAVAAFGTTINDTINAPKGEKIKTFMEGFSDLIPFMLMDKASRAVYQSKGALVNATKGFGIPNLLGYITSIGLDKNTPANLSGFKGLLHKGFNKLDKVPILPGFIGGAIRFGIIAYGVMYLLPQLGLKLSHAIFGKPSKTLKEEQEMQKEKEEAKKNMTKFPEGQQTPAQTPTQPQAGPPPSNLVEKAMQELRPSQTNAPAAGNLTQTQGQSSTPPQPIAATNTRDTAPQKSYYVTPEPVVDVETLDKKAKMNTTFEKIDKITAGF